MFIFNNSKTFLFSTPEQLFDLDTQRSEALIGDGISPFRYLRWFCLEAMNCVFSLSVMFLSIVMFGLGSAEMTVAN
ncbi:hypothetical protein Pfo_014457 [Paulownia fortunei]|nr:hypothetical protein Pfo_014457 [Paulownia fortunei]